MNRLYYGDCLTIMQGMKHESVDLIYLDPPFSSNRDYNAIYKDETGRPLPDQIEAFSDTWKLDAERKEAINKELPLLLRQEGIDEKTIEFLLNWMDVLSEIDPKLLAYLSYMVERLLLMRRLLKPTGSIYYHCDPTASHYIKVMMDVIFGYRNFRSEIIWKRTSAHGGAKRWGPIHDTIFFYTRSKRYVWNRILEEYDSDYWDKSYKKKDERGFFLTVNLTGPGVRKGSSGQPWRTLNPHPRHWALPPIRSIPDWFSFPEGYSEMTCQERLDELDKQGLLYWPPKGLMPSFKRYASVAFGNPVQDIIRDIPRASKKERIGYETQKPVALLKRIISASSNPGDVVFDPFCGCATTIEAAHRLGRKWIGIDIAIHAIKRVAKVRLEDRLRLAEGADFVINGVPRTVEGALDMWKRDKYHFQKWAIEQVDGFVTTRRSRDGGIDGRLYFALHGFSALRSMVIEVKGGENVGVDVLYRLRGVMAREKAEMAGLIVMNPPGSSSQAENFANQMAAAGVLDVLGVLYPRMQMLTVAEILDGKHFKTPSVAASSIKQTPFSFT